MRAGAARRPRVDKVLAVERDVFFLVFLVLLRRRRCGWVGQLGEGAHSREREREREREWCASAAHTAAAAPCVCAVFQRLTNKPKCWGRVEIFCVFWGGGVVDKTMGCRRQRTHARATRARTRGLHITTSSRHSHEFEKDDDVVLERGMQERLLA